ncbi:MAG: guanylate kinase, partial [Hyphomicrobiales bacterium]
MLVVSSPSGAGKSTLTRRLLKDHPSTTLSVSVTTRQPRDGEVDGRDYRFISEAEFTRLRDQGALLESACVFGNYYGTPREAVESQLAAGRNILFDIDWQGAEQLQAAMPDDVVLVFVLPPSAHELMRRLQARAQDTDEVIAKRMHGAAGEISHWRDYDHVIVNDDLEA